MKLDLSIPSASRPHYFRAMVRTALLLQFLIIGLLAFLPDIEYHQGLRFQSGLSLGLVHLFCILGFGCIWFVLMALAQRTALFRFRWIIYLIAFAAWALPAQIHRRSHLDGVKDRLLRDFTQQELLTFASAARAGTSQKDSPYQDPAALARIVALHPTFAPIARQTPSIRVLPEHVEFSWGTHLGHPVTLSIIDAQDLDKIPPYGFRVYDRVEIYQ